MSAIIYDMDDEGLVTLTLDAPGQSANTMNAAFREALDAALERLAAERETVRGVVLTSAKASFFAGGDLNALLAAKPEDAADLYARAQSVKSLLRRLETLGRPVVAAINGTALGGGFEICLACHARFALDAPGLQLGLPEATLGLLPGAGGVVRLVRLLGLEAAMPWLTEGATMAPARALSLGLLDGVVADRENLLQAARDWIRAHPEASQPWDRPGYRLPGATANSPARLAWLRSAPAALLRQTRGLYPAPAAAMCAAIEGATVDFDTASRIESRYLVQLAVHPVAKNLISTFFFQMNDIRRGRNRPEGIETARVSRLGVLGAGLMGTGIAQTAARRGILVMLKDASLERAHQGLARIARELERQVAKGSLTSARRDAILGAIEPVQDDAALADCELVIEAVPEQRALKAEVVRSAQAHLRDTAIVASNTSTLPISGLADAGVRPANFIGLHFFSPVPRMPLVEIIRGRATSDATLARAYDFVIQLGKTPIVVNDSRGFFTSRVFGMYTKEGAALLAEGVAPARIEHIAMAAGMPIGPLAVMDETSMALTWAVRQQTIADLRADGEPVPEHPGWAVIERMAVTLGRPGRAGGGGFYDYPADAPKTLWPGLAETFPVCADAVPTEDVRDRLLYAQALEAARCLEDGVLQSVGDANVGSILGIGFPRWTGGVLQFINSVGPARFVARADALAARYGDRFMPTRQLRTYAAQGGQFL